MCPIYTWRDEASTPDPQDHKNQYHIDILRHHEQCREPPTVEEVAADTKQTVEEVAVRFAAANWQKVLGQFTLCRGPNWKGAKGYWAKV